MSNLIDNRNIVGSASSDTVENDYSSSSTYNVGDLCMHNNKLYKCITQISTAEEWNSAKWQRTNIFQSVSRAITFELTITTAMWSSSQCTVVDARFENSGYIYHVSPKATENNLKAYQESGVWASEITTNGQITFNCETTPSVSLVITIEKVKVGA